MTKLKEFMQGRMPSFGGGGWESAKVNKIVEDTWRDAIESLEASSIKVYGQKMGDVWTEEQCSDCTQVGLLIGIEEIQAPTVADVVKALKTERDILHSLGRTASPLDEIIERLEKNGIRP